MHSSLVFYLVGLAARTVLSTLKERCGRRVGKMLFEFDDDDRLQDVAAVFTDGCLHLRVPKSWVINHDYLHDRLLTGG